MVKTLIYCIFCLGVLFAKVERITLNESTQWLKKVKLNIDFLGGNILLKPTNSKNKISGYMKYNKSFVYPKLKFTTVSGTGILDMATDLQFEYDLLKSYNDYGNSAELNLPNSIPLKFNLDFSLAEVDINLENIEVSSFNFNLGMGSANINFGEKYKSSDCDFLIVEVDMGTAKLKNFSNLSCEEYEIDCGLGVIIINFSTILEEYQNIDLSVGMGSIEINILEGNNIEVEINQNMLSSLDFEKMDLVKKNVYRNEDYDKSNPTILINASVGLGELSINWIK
ncbi:MAG: hypothetical protein CMF96_02460 [Candidatus Marinimicrobia bacterium]|nr:hypothetical protein [Candidatus Neomarinimicrobiota bacterium]|tara:strand:- start:4195 stop:5040 length:846 start_codon:yes stop_codon:yes gene_type:complete